MKSSIILFSLLLLLALPAFGQSYDPQYVESTNGDTLVVKDDLGYGMNSLYLLMVSDSNAPATRVYYLQSGGTYSCQSNPQSSTTYKTIIMGPEQNIKTAASNTTVFPPIVCGAYGTGINTPGGVTSRNDLLVKNIDFEIGNSNGSGSGWAFFGINGANHKLQVDNCIMEHTWWCWVGGPRAMQTIKFTNDYFVNLVGHSCRRNGGVTDFNSGSASKQDTLLVENCTHVNIQGIIYKFRQGYTVNRSIFNHNNFINCSSFIIMNNGNSTNLSITNSIFVNVQLQGFAPVLSTSDVGEVDPEGLPMGLINLRVDSTFTANVGTHGVYVDKNVTYWDPTLSDIVTTLNSGNGVDNRKDWVSQMITMNTRTSGLFANTAYPKLKNGTWTTKKPTFANTSDLFTTALATLKAFSIATVDTAYGTPLAMWRKVNDKTSMFIYADFPLPIDLSYTDTDLLTGGLEGEPVGDLGWFPTQFATWKNTQRSVEMRRIQTVLDSGRPYGTAVASTEVPKSFQLEQNYPNPFNPSTKISYTLAKAGNVTLKVYNMLGQEVATLVNGFQAAKSYDVNFNAANLSSGAYFYELKAGNESVIKKMVLMK